MPSMSMLPYALARPFLFGLDPEHAHELTLGALARLQNTPAQCLWAQPRVSDPHTVAGLRFPPLRVGFHSTNLTGCEAAIACAGTVN